MYEKKIYMVLAIIMGRMAKWLFNTYGTHQLPDPTMATFFAVCAIL